MKIERLIEIAKAYNAQIYMLRNVNNWVNELTTSEKPTMTSSEVNIISERIDRMGNQLILDINEVLNSDLLDDVYLTEFEIELENGATVYLDQWARSLDQFAQRDLVYECGQYFMYNELGFGSKEPGKNERTIDSFFESAFEYLEYDAAGIEGLIPTVESIKELIK